MGKFNWVLLCSLLLLLSSCYNRKHAIYFNNIKDSTIVSSAENLEPVIQKNDLLSISINSLNNEATQLFNAPNNTVNQVSGYLVSQEGIIQLPILGNIMVAGMTKTKLKQTISKSLIDRKLLLDPVVDVRYLNYKVTVIGEVGNPTVITSPNEKLTLLEAIGLAGDLTVNAKRSNVMVIREVEGMKTVKRLDLTKTDLFTSPYYYLKSNDVVYVEPNNAKLYNASKTNAVVPIVISSLSLALLVADRFVN